MNKCKSLIILRLAWLLFPSLVYTQTGFNFQAVYRDANGEPLRETNITVGVGLYDNAATEVHCYFENHATITSPLGVFSLEIGRGQAIFGQFDTLDWSRPKYLGISLSIEGGTEQMELPLRELLSVPKALFASRVLDLGALERNRDTLFHRLTNGQTDTVLLSVQPPIPSWDAVCSTPVCKGDSLHLFVATNDAYDSIRWYAPNGEMIFTGNGALRVDDEVLTSGGYRAALFIAGNSFNQTKWVSIDDCILDVRDDIFVVNNDEQAFFPLANDRDNGPIRLCEIDNVPVSANATIVLDGLPDLLLRINETGDGFYVSVNRPFDTLIQIVYEASDSYGNVREAKSTLFIKMIPTADSLAIGVAEFQSLVNATDIGDTLNLEHQTVLVKGKPLNLNKAITLSNAKIRRASTSVTFLAVPSGANAQEIIVESTADFALGDWLLIVDGPNYLSNSGGQICAISAINGDTIRTHQPFINPMPTGSRVVHQFPLVRSTPLAGSEITFENVVFDGNKSGNPYTFDWRYNSTIKVSTGVNLRNCTFYNNPAENIFMCGGSIEHCRAFGLNGSFVHGSCTINNTSESLVLNNYTRMTCLRTVMENGHNEGWFTYSANVRNFILSDNSAIAGGNACFGAQGLDDFGNTFTGNIFNTFPRRKFATATNHPAPDNLEMNTFINIED